MNRPFLIAFAFSSFLLLDSCVSKKEERCAPAPDTKGILVDIAWQSLEDSLPAIKSKQELVNFFSRHPTMRDLFFNRKSYPDDSVFINELYHRFTNPAIDSLLRDTKRVFGDGSFLHNEFTQAFTLLKYYYPQIPIPRVETVITGLESDLFVSDSLIIVGLDHYLGNQSRYKPQMYEYMLRRYQKNFIVPSAMLLYGIDQRYNLSDAKDKTVLAEMITYGKAYFFAKKMLPCTPDSILIGYTSKEFAGAKENQDLIWKRLIEDEALFSITVQMKQRFIGERPKTYEVGNECPGRIGTWVGWQIINKYEANHPDISLTEIMKMSESQKIFKDAKYRPDK